MSGVREDMWRVSLTIDGQDWGVWDQRNGGKTSANGVTFRPGGMGPQQSLGGVPTTDVLTIARNYQHQRDHDKIGGLYAKVGVGFCVAKAIPLDINGNAYGNPVVWQGLLDSVDAPPHDSESTKAAMVTLTIAVEGNPTSS
jgi:hypothetical protein